MPESGQIKTPISEVTSLLKISDSAVSGSGISELASEVQRIPDYLNALELRLAGRISEILSNINKTAPSSIEEKLGMILFEKLLDDPSKANQMVSAMNQFQDIGKKEVVISNRKKPTK